jgi:hypothetical protein
MAVKCLFNLFEDLLASGNNKDGNNTELPDKW